MFPLLYPNSLPPSTERRVPSSNKTLGKSNRKIEYCSISNMFYRVLTKSVSAEIQITLRSTTISGPTARAQPIPLEPFSVNKEMGRVLIRRAGETIAAGMMADLYLEMLPLK